jgi:hypothetical protein
MIRAWAVLAAALAMSSCTALRLYVAAGPTDCRDGRGVHVACAKPWP